MTDKILVAYDIALNRLESAVFGSGHRNVSEVPLYCLDAIDSLGLVNGRNMATDGAKVDLLTVTLATDLDVIRNKVTHISVTQPVDLDAIEARVNALDASVVLMGVWDVTATSLFPVSTKSGESWIVSVAGSVDGVSFDVNDRIVALVDGASTSTYATQWHKLDYTDEVLSVAGKTGAVVLVEADITDLQDYLLETDIDSIGKLNTIVGETILISGADPTFDGVIFNSTSPAHQAGHLFYNSADGGSLQIHVEEPDITLNLGEEEWMTVRNDSGITIPDGTPVYITGYSGGIAQVEPVIANGFQVVGLTTHSLEDGTIGKATRAGFVSGPDTSSWSVNDTLYVSSTVAGELTNVAPLWPLTTIEVGTVAISAVSGKIYVRIEHHGLKNVAIKSYNFSARNASSGTYYLGGFYDFSTTDANLTQASTTETHGTADAPYGAHAAIVFGAAATDGTTVTLTVTGDSFDDVTGVLTAADSEVLYTGPAAGLTLNDFVESEKRFNGEITFTLSSDGVNFSMDFNYGFARAERFDQDVTMRTGEVTGLADATDSGLYVELIRHTAAGWTYAASGFDDPGSSARYSMQGDYGSHGIFAGEHFTWKRTELVVPLDASINEGLVMKVVTTANNSVAYMNVHLGVVGQ